MESGSNRLRDKAGYPGSTIWHPAEQVSRAAGIKQGVMSFTLFNQDFSCIVNGTHPTFIQLKGKMPRRLSEELTRKEMIDPQLEKAGWYLRDHSRVKIEIPLPSWSLQEEFPGLVARVESLRGRMAESERQAEELSPKGDASRFESFLAESFREKQF